jgi:hypothetical protein
MREFQCSTLKLDKFFGYLQNYPIVLTNKFKELFNAKSVVEMTLVKAQHQICLVQKLKIDI